MVNDISRPEAVISDLDGTLIDSRAAMTHAIRVGCAAVGRLLAAEQDLDWTVGPRIEDSLRTLVGPERMPAAREAYRAEYRRSGPELTRPMPDAREVLAALRAAGIPVAIATYKPTPLAELILGALGMRSLVDIVMGRALDGDERPKSALVRQALTALKLGSHQVLYVGDHDEDQSAAAHLGVAFCRYGPWTWPQIHTLLRGDQVQEGSPLRT
jgi:phosphoglycolate phosphatase